MSNEDKQRRDEYNKRRKKWMFIQAIVIFVFAIVSLFSYVKWNKNEEALYINYNETSDVDYKVYYVDNDYFDEEYQPEDQAYLASLIDYISADFKYELTMESKDVNYEYSYKVDAQIEIIDPSTEKSLWSPVTSIKTEQKHSQNSKSKLMIRENVRIDYDDYNKKATEFISIYNLPNAKSYLTIKTSINVISSCKDFKENGNNQHVVSLRVPLTKQTVDIEIAQSAPANNNKILACKQNDAKVVPFKVLFITFTSLDVLAILVLVAYMYLTRNKDINYAIKVNRIVSNYKSYIQKINNEFSTDGYQVLFVDNFEEMLELRDTIKEPILMFENEDKTRTVFVIPAKGNLLYSYEIKVEGYDEMYLITPTQEETQQIEEVPVVEEINEEVIENKETVENKEVALDDNIEENLFENRHDYSFEAKLTLADYQTKHFYKVIMNYVQTYDVKVSRSWKKERIYLGRKSFAILSFKGKKLSVAFALDPKEFENTKYKLVDVSNVKKFNSTPSLLKLTSERKVKYTIELLKEIFIRNNVVQNDNKVTTKVPYKSKNALIKKGLIKTNIKEKELV